MPDGLTSAVRLYMFAMLGLFLLVTPWTPVWDQATMGLLPPPGGSWVRSGWARGLACGLGALDLMAAAAEALALWRWLAGAGRAGGRGS